MRQTKDTITEWVADAVGGEVRKDFASGYRLYAQSNHQISWQSALQRCRRR